MGGWERIEEGEYRLGIYTNYRKYSIDGRVIDEKKDQQILN